jgi:FkbM family methyltransferase
MLQALPGSARLVRRLHEIPLTVASGPAAGLRFRAGRSSWAWASGGVEADVASVLANLLTPGTTFFDVGANVGFYTIMAARRVGATGKVVAFEPVPENVASLRTNVAMNRLSNVMVEQVAVSSSARQATLDVSDSLEAKLVETPATRWSILVTTLSLDLFIRQSGLCPDLVKIDVEGHEAAVIEGMRTTLADARPIVLAEMHGTNQEFVAAFDGLRYRLGPVEFASTVEEAPWWAHVLCVPTERPWPERCLRPVDGAAAAAGP